MKIVNLTPHAIVLNDGATYPPSGTVARITCTYGDPDEHGIAPAQFADPVNLPDPVDGVTLIVSGILASAPGCRGRRDLVTPATGHPDCVRGEDGRIVSVPFLVRSD